MKFQKIAFPAVCILALSALIYSNCTGPAQEPDKEVHPSSLEAATASGFLGDQACLNCHQEEYQEWKGSHHDLAMQPASDTSVLGDFGGVTLAYRGIEARFFRKGDKFMVNTQGEDGQNHDYEIVYTFGVTPLQQYLVALPGGRYQTLRETWDSEQNKWFAQYPDLDIDPQEWLHWTHGAMNWNHMCADCHSTNFVKNFDPATDTYNSTYDVVNVSCEACHGAGQEHINYISKGLHEQAATQVEGALMRLSTGITSTEQVDQCAACHARRSQVATFHHEGAFMDYFIPEILSEGMYHADGQIQDEVYVYGSFVQSKMYHRGVKCTDCHNPHTLKLKFEGNQLCLQCHEPKKYDSKAHHFHTLESEAGKCVSCHMTGKLYMGNDFRRDHSFRIPRPDQSEKYGTPNACNGCHTDKEARWARQAVERWYGKDRAPHFSDRLIPGRARSPEALPGLVAMLRDTATPAIARATAVSYLRAYNEPEALSVLLLALKDSAALVRINAANSLAGLSAEDRAQVIGPLLKDEFRSVRITAANVLADVPESSLSPELVQPFRIAQGEFKNSLDLQADFRNGQMIAAQFYARTGRQPEAEKAYRKALELDNLFNAARMNLATLLNGQSRNDEAIYLLETVIEQEPEVGEAWYSLGLLLAEEQRIAEAETALKKAAHLDGNTPRMFYNWGLALQHQEKMNEAEQAFLEGLESFPEDESLHNGLVILYLQLEEPAKARPHVKFLLERYPDNPQLMQLWKQVGGL